MRNKSFEFLLPIFNLLLAGNGHIYLQELTAFISEKFDFAEAWMMNRLQLFFLLFDGRFRLFWAHSQ